MSAITISGRVTPEYAQILSEEALAFVAALQRNFNARREELLARRAVRQRDIEAGVQLDFLPETAAIRSAAWRVAATPEDLQDRRTEITGPVERKMMINALNSGAKVFMADLEDANSPTWDNAIQGQINLGDAVRRRISFTSPEGKEYRLNDKVATIMVRPRGWHMIEKHASLDGRPVSASLFDFGCISSTTRKTSPWQRTVFLSAQAESHLEARRGTMFSSSPRATAVCRPAASVRPC
jgi:malate synthase